MEEDQKYIDQNEKQEDSYEYYEDGQSVQEIIRYPIVDPKKPFVCQDCGVGKFQI